MKPGICLPIGVFQQQRRVRIQVSKDAQTPVSLESLVAERRGGKEIILASPGDSEDSPSDLFPNLFPPLRSLARTPSRTLDEVHLAHQAQHPTPQGQHATHRAHHASEELGLVRLGELGFEQVDSGHSELEVAGL